MERLGTRNLARRTKGLLLGLSILLATDGANAGSVVISQWDFNNASTGSSTGDGRAGLVGGVSQEFFSGSPGDPVSTGNSGWSISSYPTQGTGNKREGVQFNVSTAGKQNIVLRWDQRVSPTASRYSRLQYSTNRVDFIDF